MEIQLKDGRRVTGRIKITVKESCILNTRTGHTEIILGSGIRSIRPQ